MKIYVDIDGTICKTKGNNYQEAKPIVKNIAKINKLHDAGHQIYYWTARGNTTGLNLRKFTERQLQDWNCKYTELSVMRKPSYDYLIDDRTLRIDELFNTIQIK
jgi:histidinol phosphatase-like enzyme